MRNLITIIIIALVAYGGYSLYMSYGEPVSVIVDKTRSDPGADVTGTYESNKAVIDIIQHDAVRVQVSISSKEVRQSISSQPGDGMIFGLASLHKGVAVFSKNGCRISMTFNGNIMDLEDNGSCGGPSTGYTGRYTTR